MAAVICSICCFPCSSSVAVVIACSLAIFAFSALFATRSWISLMVAASSSTEDACSVAPWARDCALLATWSEPLETCKALMSNFRRVSFSVWMVFWNDALIGAKSPT